MESDITVEVLRSMKFKLFTGVGSLGNAYALSMPGGSITVEFMASEPGYVGDLYRITAGTYQNSPNVLLPRMAFLSQLIHLIYWMGGIDYRAAHDD